MAAPWWDSDSKDRSGLEYRCYVRNLPYSVDDRALKDAFSSNGAVSAEVVYDRETGMSRGFGFATFEDGASQKAAIENMNGRELGGRTITVAEAQQRPRKWKA